MFGGFNGDKHLFPLYFVLKIFRRDRVMVSEVRQFTSRIFAAIAIRVANKSLIARL